MTAPITVSAADLPLPCLYRWERERTNQVYLTQPTGGGRVLDITWREAADQVRRAATWLASQGWPEGSRVAIIGKNSAHWILADLAIQMAGHISIPIYPTFNGEALTYILSTARLGPALLARWTTPPTCNWCTRKRAPDHAAPGTRPQGNPGLERPAGTERTHDPGNRCCTSMPSAPSFTPRALPANPRAW